MQMYLAHWQIIDEEPDVRLAKPSIGLAGGIRLFTVCREPCEL
jgi:hypothetical protein